MEKADSKIKDYFDPKKSSEYDRKIRTSIPGYEALHDMVYDFLGMSCPEEADILVVGAGTGMELVRLGLARPRWKFTAVDISEDILSICAKNIESAGIGERVEIHHGPLGALETSKKFDAATSILVSHFISSQTDKSAYFRSISNMLKQSGVLVSADLAGDASSSGSERLISAWISHRVNAGIPKKEVEEDYAKSRAVVSLIPENEYEDMLSGAGFTDVVQFYRAFLFCGWTGRKS